MDCNCKNKFKSLEKYADDIEEEHKNNIFEYIIQFIFKMAFGLLIGLILIVIVIPFLLYLIVCLMFKKEPSFRIINFKKYFNKNGDK